MIGLQKNTHDLPFEIPERFMDHLVLLKVDSLDNEVDKINGRLAAIEKNNEKELWKNSAYQPFFSIEERQKRAKIRREHNLFIKDPIQDCKKIIERTLEILSDWSKIQDIKLQIQYAAVITGKIDNIKKTDYIQSNSIRKKICTLLKNVIRINVTDIIFSEEQISLLKKGFLLLLSEEIQKKDMLQLNRSFLDKQLLTMPAWE